jgi:hypothetical protein
MIGRINYFNFPSTRYAAKINEYQDQPGNAELD